MLDAFSDIIALVFGILGASVVFALLGSEYEPYLVLVLVIAMWFRAISLLLKHGAIALLEWLES